MYPVRFFVTCFFSFETQRAIQLPCTLALLVIWLLLFETFSIPMLDKTKADCVAVQTYPGKDDERKKEHGKATRIVV